jgi:site-specific DNA-methyltransferase (adenine-specific)
MRVEHAEALAFMATLEPQSVDAIITDLPYGTTSCKWDTIIPFAPMWAAVKRVLKPRGAFVTTASQPFTSALVMSNAAWFRYRWVWEKNIGTRFLDAKHRPLLYHEDIPVFSVNGHTYNPQMTKVNHRFVTRSGHASQYQEYQAVNTSNNGVNYPRSILSIARADDTDHPTQKPVALYAYLIRTYTNEGETVLDFCMGSGTTGVACAETGRDFIGCDTDAGYVEIARRRIEAAQMQLRLDV